MIPSEHSFLVNIDHGWQLIDLGRSVYSSSNPKSEISRLGCGSSGHSDITMPDQHRNMAYRLRGFGIHSYKSHLIHHSMSDLNERQLGWYLWLQS